MSTDDLEPVPANGKSTTQVADAADLASVFLENLKNAFDPPVWTVDQERYFNRHLAA
jgi:hypothetical protein